MSGSLRQRGLVLLLQLYSRMSYGNDNIYSSFLQIHRRKILLSSISFFEKTFQDRDLLLQGQSVLLVIGKSKKEIEKRQPFVFLTHALGSANVGRCADLAAAAQLLVQGQWDWVYVDSDQSSIAGAAAELFGTGAPARSVKGSFKKGKKRKRDDGEAEELVAKGEVAGRRVRVANAEFVIQSLILGALVDE